MQASNRDKLWVALVGLLVLGSPCADAADGAQTAAAVNMAGKLCFLSQRADRQFFMYKYHIGELAASKAPLIDTVAEFDEALDVLRRGSTARGVQAPSSKAVTEQLQSLNTEWAKLREVYTYQYTAPWSSNELLPRILEEDNPVIIRYVDKLTEKIGTRCEALIDYVAAECNRSRRDECNERIGTAGNQRTLAELVVKEVLFLKADIDSKDKRRALSDHAQRFSATHQKLDDFEKSQTTQSTWRISILDTIRAYWKQMQILVDLAVDGKARRVNETELLRVQQQLVGEIDAYVSASF